MAPLLIAGARARGLDPRPFLIALCGASNAGSAATLIGSPQNILIGQIGNLSFQAYLFTCAVPALVGLIGVLRGHLAAVARPDRGHGDGGDARGAGGAAPPATTATRRSRGSLRWRSSWACS